MPKQSDIGSIKIDDLQPIYITTEKAIESIIGNIQARRDMLFEPGNAQDEIDMQTKKLINGKMDRLTVAEYHFRYLMNPEIKDVGFNTYILACIHVARAQISIHNEMEADFWSDISRAQSYLDCYIEHGDRGAIKKNTSRAAERAGKGGHKKAENKKNAINLITRLLEQERASFNWKSPNDAAIYLASILPPIIHEENLTLPKKTDDLIEFIVKLISDDVDVYNAFKPTKK
jgi:hypothetical protein